MSRKPRGARRVCCSCWWWWTRRCREQRVTGNMELIYAAIRWSSGIRTL